MKQFDVCENLVDLADAPYLLVLQSDLLMHMPVRFVAPLVALADINPIQRLNPEFMVEGERVVLAIFDLVGLPNVLIGRTVANLDAERHKIIAAIDMLFTGI